MTKLTLINGDFISPFSTKATGLEICTFNVNTKYLQGKTLTCIMNLRLLNFLANLYFYFLQIKAGLTAYIIL
jgi:hypothetical protein